MKIQLTRDVLDDGVPYSNGSQLTEADVPLGTLKSLVQTGWAVEVREKSNAKITNKKPSAPSTESELTADTAKASAKKPSKVETVEDADPDDELDSDLIADLDISKNAIAALRKEGIETLEQAEAYIAKNGSLEPINGVSKAAADAIAAILKSE